MGVIRFGPYIEQLAPNDSIGRRRFTDYAATRSLSESLRELHDFGDVRRSDLSSRMVSTARGILSDVEGHLLGFGRPVDKWLALKHGFTNHDFVEENFDREYNPRFPHRIAVDARVNKAGNLSVTISPRCLSERGLLEKAPEWRDEFGMYTSSTGGFGERPGNEVLYIGLVEEFVDCQKPLSRMTEQERRLHATIAKAINLAFWVEIGRLRVNYEVHLGRYLAFRDHDPASDSVASLELVDAVQDHRDDIQKRVGSFTADTGYEASEFWAVCLESKVGLSFEKCSKRLRLDSGPGLSLTPSVVRKYYDLLETAINYGFVSV